MKIIKLNCAACGAPISIPENLEQLSCSNCGTYLMVEHGEGYYALRAVEQLSEAIQQSGKGTQDAIREGAQITQIELKRLQLSQTLNGANAALNATQSEERSLARSQMTPAAMRQLQQLKLQEFSQLEEIRPIHLQMDLLDGIPLEVNAQALTNQIKLLDRSVAVLRSCPQSPMNQQILQHLLQERQKYQEFLNTFKANQMRENIISFEIKPPFSTDLNELVRQLRQIQSDLAVLSRHAPNPITARLRQELTQLNDKLYQHFHQEVYRQCWGEVNPAEDPGQDFQKLGHHLHASRETAQWLSAVPVPSKTVKKEIKQFQKAEKHLAKNFEKAQEQHRITEAVKVLCSGLAAFAITAPFSSNLTEVRGQVSAYQRDLQSLQERPSSPEVKQAQKELNGRYQDLYQHWASLETQALKAQLKSAGIQPPFSNDFSKARADYDLITADLQMLKEKADIPGVQGLIQRLAANQRLFYTHLQKLAAASNGDNDSQVE